MVACIIQVGSDTLMSFISNLHGYLTDALIPWQIPWGHSAYKHQGFSKLLLSTFESHITTIHTLLFHANQHNRMLFIRFQFQYALHCKSHRTQWEFHQKQRNIDHTHIADDTAPPKYVNHLWKCHIHLGVWFSHAGKWRNNCQNNNTRWKYFVRI